MKIAGDLPIIVLIEYAESLFRFLRGLVCGIEVFGDEVGSFAICLERDVNRAG